MNLTVPFFTPEEYFLGDKPADYILGAFNPLNYIPTSTITTSDTTISPDLSDTFTSIETVPVPVVPIIQPPKEPDIVLFVGSPASGKSSFFREYLAPMGYERINQDTLKTRDRCVMEATVLLEKNIPIAIGNSLLVPIHIPSHLLTFYPYSLLLLSRPVPSLVLSGLTFLRQYKSRKTNPQNLDRSSQTILPSHSLRSFHCLGTISPTQQLGPCSRRKVSGEAEIVASCGDI